MEAFTEADLRQVVVEHGGDFADMWAWSLFAHGEGKAPKRLRPALAHAASLGLGLSMEQVRGPAVITELVHTASLMLDDVQDGDAERRGVPAAHVIFDVESAELASIDMLTYAKEAAIELDGQHQLGGAYSRLVTHTSRELLAGQLRDLRLAKKGTPVTSDNLAELDEVTRKKTSPLMVLPLVGAALMAGKTKDSQVVTLLTSFGENFGTAFQIQDDAFDTDDEPRGNSYVAALGSVGAAETRSAEYYARADQALNAIDSEMETRYIRAISRFIGSQAVHF